MAKRLKDGLVLCPTEIRVDESTTVLFGQADRAVSVDVTLVDGTTYTDDTDYRRRTSLTSMFRHRAWHRR